MPAERRGAGRWRRDEQTDGNPTGGSARTGYTCRRDPARDRWYWVEPRVWTERMLTALEQGVKGGKWFRLIDKVYAAAPAVCLHASEVNHGAAGVDHCDGGRVPSATGSEPGKALGTRPGRQYRPQAVRRHWIKKLGSKERRPLGIPTVRDRVAQTALKAVLEPIFERDFAAQSYGFRPKRGCKDALRRVDHR